MSVNQVGVTKAITNLNQAHQKLGLSPSPDANFFPEWQGPLPPLTDTQKLRLDHLKHRYLHYADSGAITEGTINLILLSDRHSYALSDKFTLSTATGNDLYSVAQILTHLASVA